MKKILFLLIFLFFLSKVHAQPTIENVIIEPKNVICFEDSCDNVLISVNCTGNNPEVRGTIFEPIQMILTFTKQNNIYKTIVPYYLFEKKSTNYKLNITCQDSSGQTSNVTSFFVSLLEANIDSIESPSYIGDSITNLKVSIKKDDLPLKPDMGSVSFSLKPLELKNSYFSDPFYVVVFSVPGTKGTYNLELTTNISIPDYKSKEIKMITALEVKEPIEFNILSVDKTEIRPNDTITISLSASERGNNIILNKDYLNFRVNSTTIASDKVSITSAGSYFNAKIEMPDLSPGQHDLKITLNYKSYSMTKTTSVYYVIPISGKFVDLDNKGINTEIKFLVDDVEKKKITTDSSGSYSGYIIPGTYTIQLNFPKSTLYIYDVTIDDFSDSIRHYFFDADVPGIKNAGLFFYEVDLAYSKVKIVINYDEKKLPTENNIIVYKCSEWNFESKKCNTNWEEQDATIDTIRNTVTIETNSLSAYTLGIKKSLYLDFSSEKSTFNLKELIKLRGVVRDESGNFVQDALLNAKVNEVNIEANAYSGSNGVFTLEFFAPEEEGIYNLLVKAKKSPYSTYNKTWSFQVMRNRKVSLVVPDTIRIGKGENQTLQFSVVNTGQADISELYLSLAGLPKEYFTLQEKIDEIKIGQEVKVPVSFNIPKDANEGTLSITFRVNSTDVSQEEIIGFTIFSENVTLTTISNQKIFPAFRIPTAQIALPIEFSDVSYAFVFCIAFISITYFWKRGKNWRIKEREHVKNLLSDIKGEIRRKKVSVQNSNRAMKRK